MPIYGLSYHKLVQTSYFHSDGPLSLRDACVVALDQGQVLARVVSGPHEDLEDAEVESLPRVLRAAGQEDFDQDLHNAEMARTAGDFWKDRVRERGLDMKLVDVEVFLDRSKIIFYFTSMSRIDFRELVKDLVHEYRVRIEFRQIGVRHETQMIGAVGNCGMVCCCRRYLHQFAPVTIRMAKEQNLFLNPSKVSGMCGRLLCCLAYEQESYEKFHNESPRLGKRYMTAEGQFKVIRSNMFHSSVTCVAESGDEVKFSLDEWNALEPRRVEGNAGPFRDGERPARTSDAPEGAAPEAGAEGAEKPREGRDERRGRAPQRGEKRQTFVTGRMSFRQQTRRSQEALKREAAGREAPAAREAGREAPGRDSQAEPAARSAQPPREQARDQAREPAGRESRREPPKREAPRKEQSGRPPRRPREEGEQPEPHGARRGREARPEGRPDPKAERGRGPKPPQGRPEQRPDHQEQANQKAARRGPEEQRAPAGGRQDG